MRRKLLGVALAAAVTTTMFAALEGDARACGGCFGPPPPPTEQPTVVTDHRMILSISPQQSTLYDQIRYQGSPASFAWVLPIVGEVKVGLSSDAVFGTLDAMTQTVIQAPPQNCPAPPVCNGSSSGGFASAGAAPEDANGGVTVTKREVVGPYETVQLKATDPAGLRNWLSNNGFTIPADVSPVIDQYVTEKFDFLALKLVPGKDVKDMRPVRVTSTGAAVVLPLRMVAAGTGPVVGVSLWVVGEGRYQPQNFPSFFITTDELVWDWRQQKSNYTELRAERTAQGAGRAWETESSMLLDRGTVENSVKYGFVGGGRGRPTPVDPEAQAQEAYLPEKNQDGTIKKSAEQVRAEDLETLFYGIPSVATRVTRMRADLSHAALNQDLVMTASPDQSLLASFRQVVKELNEPLCPVYNGCTTIGSAPRSEAIARANGDTSESFSCSTSAKTRTSTPSTPAWFGLGAGFLALAIVKASRARRRNL
ncbi:MAG: DUF2330 domain-containing protein [Deltaproteobacteria bacterium]|nr:DUF2330 domain-containing protein [Deltaproteobacteria bacterium]